MKYLIIFLILISSLFANEKVTIGLGSYFKTQPYKGVSTLVLPSPVIFYDNGIAYIRWSRLGVYFLGKKKSNYAWGVSLTALPRTYGYDSSDIAGMQKRKNSWEGGLSFAIKSKKHYVELLFLDDILNKHKTYTAQIEFGTEFKIKKFSFYPTIFVTYQSAKFLDYYYGVTKEESITSKFNQYHPSSGYLIGAQTYISYPLTKKLSTFFNFKLDKIPSSANSSPLVEDSYIYSGILSLIYTFKI
jgi:outer membrane protein